MILTFVLINFPIRSELTISELIYRPTVINEKKIVNCKETLLEKSVIIYFTLLYYRSILISKLLFMQLYRQKRSAAGRQLSPLTQSHTPVRRSQGLQMVVTPYNVYILFIPVYSLITM